jgi:hypothetical protein
VSSWFKNGRADADVKDVDHDEQTSAQRAVPRDFQPRLPSLPQRVAPVVAPNDVWFGVQAEPDHLHPAFVLQVEQREPMRQLWTQPARVLVLVGLLGIVAAAVIQIEVLLPLIRRGRSTDLRISPAESTAFAVALGVSAVSLPVGWLWWATAAAFNARRLARLTTSPFLPVSMFVLAPIVFGVASQMSGGLRDWVFVTAWILSTFSYFIVFASLRGTAARISASVTQFSRMLWLPLAWIFYRASMFALVAMYDGPGTKEWVFFGVLVVELIFPVMLALSTWRALGSFRTACRRLNRRQESLGFPSGNGVARALQAQVAGQR